MRHFRTTIVPLLLMLTTPVAIALFWMTCVYFNGSLYRFFTEISLGKLSTLWPRPSLTAAKIIGTFALLEALLMVGLPGKTYQGPVTPTGNRPTYKLNGIPAYAITHILLYLGAYRLHWFSPSIVYDNYGAILTSLTLFALLFCVFLYFKGSYFPSSSDSGRSGNLVFDYYWGVELHPHIGKFNLKQYANCRLGMMGWSVIILSFLAAQYEKTGHVSTSMAVSVAIQIVYIVKFFWWESGYFGSLDIMHDRFGYYICWGVLCWIPGVYTLTSLYLVDHPVALSVPYAIAVLVLGVLAIWANYDADAQRQRVRRTEGKTTVWGAAPDLILAEYTTTDGQRRKNLLLVSGWWGLARHVHYVTELTAALAWSLPALFDNFIPYFYFFYLCILLFDRSGRDEKRCAVKYGPFWEEYRRRVPFRIIPRVF